MQPAAQNDTIAVRAEESAREPAAKETPRPATPAPVAETPKHVWTFRDVWKYNPRNVRTTEEEQQRVREANSEKASAKIAYAITVLHPLDSGTRDAAAVLAYSIKRAVSLPHVVFKHAEMVAIVHPSAMASRDDLVKAGYKVVERDVPIDVAKIENEFMRTAIVKDGCCGEKELLKLHAFALTDYYRVFLLDIDVLFLQVRFCLHACVLASIPQQRASTRM